MVKLGVNIDHVATLRQQRHTPYPNLLRAAQMALQGGADFITVHLREDRRHIQLEDVWQLKQYLDSQQVGLNLECALLPKMLALANELIPEQICIVPEKRQELTTEGGLDAVACQADLQVWNSVLKDKVRLGVFLDPDPHQIAAVLQAGVGVIELHTGTYAQSQSSSDWVHLLKAAQYAQEQGLEVHAGHGLTYETVAAVAQIEAVVELNIGHALVAEALFVGLEKAVLRMKKCLASLPLGLGS